MVRTYFFIPYILVGFIACASTPDKKPEAIAEAKSGDETLLQLNRLNSKIETLENRLEALNDKLEVSRTSQAPTAIAPKTPSQSAMPHKTAGDDVKPSTAPSDPEAGFINDPAVQSYRNAMIVFEAQKYPDAVLAFSQFLENYPDHPLAGSAQYHVGRCYFNQKEYTLAAREYKRVLTTYDRSPHIADTLSDIAESEDKLAMSEAAAKHRLLLTSLFPNSPAAKNSSKPIADIPPENINPDQMNPKLDEPPVPPTAPIKP
jgi:tol-pal system protein YbgF